MPSDRGGDGPLRPSVRPTLERCDGPRHRPVRRTGARRRGCRPRVPGDRLPGRRRARRARAARRRDRRGRTRVLRPPEREKRSSQRGSRRSASPPTAAAQRAPGREPRQGDSGRPEGVARLGPGRAGVRLARAPTELRRVLQEYHEAISGLGERLRRLFRPRARPAEDWFEDKFRDHSSSIRVVNYPAPEGEPEHGQLRAGAHTDYGCMTSSAPRTRPAGSRSRRVRATG